MTIHLYKTIDGHIAGVDDVSDGLLPQGRDDSAISAITVDSISDLYDNRAAIYAYRPRWCIRVNGWERDTGSGAPAGYCNGAFGTVHDNGDPGLMYFGCPPISPYVDCVNTTTTGSNTDPDGALHQPGVLYYAVEPSINGAGALTRSGSHFGTTLEPEGYETDYTLSRFTSVGWAFTESDITDSPADVVSLIMGFQAGSMFGPGLPVVDTNLPTWFGLRHGDAAILGGITNEQIWSELDEEPPEGEGFDHEPFPGILLSIELLISKASDPNTQFSLTGYKTFAFGTSLATLLGPHCAMVNVNEETSSLPYLGCKQGTITYDLW